jgi:trimeric autotransporter adhesin
VVHRYQRLYACLVALCLALAPAAAHAQIRSATITGTVTDSTGAVLPGASVVVTNQETNAESTLATNDEGLFTAPYLPAGTYTVTVTLQGFTAFKRTGLILTTAQTIRVTAELKMSDFGETVEVAAAAPLLQVDNATVESGTTAKMIEALPNITQNPLAYSMLQAGVVGRTATSDTSSLNSFGIGVNGRRQWSSVGVNGGRAFTNDIQLDGLPVMGGGYNEASVVPNTEGLAEVKVISNNFSAEYGRGQAIISMNTKSGTNSFNGTLGYQMRNENLDANTFSNNALKITKPEFRVHDLGGSFGGPIIRNKLFFFSSYHQLRHDNDQNIRSTVPTALERVGNFSQTFIRDESGNPIPARIFDPFNVVQEGPDLYRRVEIPNAIIPNPDPFAVRMLSFYPLPNRTPDDVFNLNNHEATIHQTVRRYSSNNRVDLRLGGHSLYGSGGISYAEIVTPRQFGQSPFNGAAGVRGDKNPYLQIGDAFVLNPSTIIDVRYGVSRINTKDFSGDKEGFDDYASFGVPGNLVPLILFPGAAPNINPNAYGGAANSATSGVGGGSNWSSLVSGNFNTKRELQTSHSIAGSVTKTNGRWVHKMGGEYRVLLSNYADPEQASVALPSPNNHAGGNFNFEYLTADGQIASLTRTNAQRGVNAAGLLLGAGLYWIRPGASLTPAYAQKYFAIYSQNDWRPTAKLTINLGLRYEIQPGPTERFDRMSSWDLNAASPYGTQGAIAFPGVGGYSRNMWDTTYNNIGPRLGAAYQLNNETVIRGGFGITYLPSNTGFFSGPTDYGSANFSAGVQQLPYGTNPRGIPARFSDPVPIAPAIGGNPDAPQIYGIGEARFARDFKNGRSMQWNLFVERTFFDTYLVSIGYSASASRNLINRAFPIQNLQSIPADVLAGWRDQYIASNGTLNPATQQVPNPYQNPASPLPFAGPLAAQTVARQTIFFPYPLLIGSNAAINSSGATADYHSMQLNVQRRFSNGLMFNASYTWSKGIDSSDNHGDDNQGFNAGGNARNYSLLDPKLNRRLSLSDVPHRFVASYLYELPFGEDKKFGKSGLLKHLAGGWQLGGSVIWQSGFPIGISGASSGAALARPDRVDGVDFEVPQDLQRWYDGRTTVTLPSGRRITPPANTFLKYNPDAFAGRVVITPNGRIVADQYWFGNAQQVYDDIRTDPRFNIDLTIRRSFRISQGMTAEVGADAMNVLNHTQFNGSNPGAWVGNLGATQLTNNPSAGLIVGTGDSNSFGTRGMTTYNPRQIMLRVGLRF